MLKLVHKNEKASRSVTFHKGYWDALQRVKGIMSVERSKNEWAGLLFVFRMIVHILEIKIKSEAKFRIVE